MASEIGEEEWWPVQKRSRFAAPPVNNQQSSNTFSLIPPNINPVDESGPLGLSLRKTPSLLELLQAMLLSKSQVTGPSPSPPDDSGSKKDIIKASRFSASVLRIGNWEYVSRYEGDLVVKCYFGKHQLVWEVFDHDGRGDGVKSKMEIQWSDITGLKADCPRGTLTLTLARKPAFFRETDPQPRKHTVWLPTVDFTGGQATEHMQHYIECPPGVLDKHYEKLVQCDTRLAILSRQPAEILSVGCDGGDYRPLAPTSDEDCNSSLPSTANDDDDMLENMARVLLNSTYQCGTDQTSLLRKVNSLGCCLVQEEDDIGFDLVNDYMVTDQQEPMMARQDWFGDMFLNVPPIASPPLFDDIGFDLASNSMNDNITQQQEPMMMPRQDSIGDLLHALSHTASPPKLDDIGFDLVNDDMNTEQQEPMMPRQDSSGDFLLDLIASPPNFNDICMNLVNDPTNENILEPMMPRQDSFGDMFLNDPRIASPPMFDDIGFDPANDSMNDNITEQQEPMMMPRQDSYGDLLDALSHIASPPKLDDIGFDLMNDSTNDNITEQQQVPMMPRQDSYGDLLHDLPPFASPPKFL